MTARVASLFVCSFCGATYAAELAPARLVPIAPGFAATSVNTTIFRHNSLTTHNDVQYTAFYDNDAHVVLAKRKIGEGSWTIRRTELIGNPYDAHNAIVLAADASDTLHIMWNHHNSELNYVRTTGFGSLEVTGRQRTDGVLESSVTYPEMCSLPDGSVMLVYRSGSSGNGDIVLKRFGSRTRTWTTAQPRLIAGEGRHSAYVEFCIDSRGTLHFGWTWRRTGDVATNHDICYARSADLGKTWTDSNNAPITVPITSDNAEYALRIPENSDLINQTSIAADAAGHPYIATYFRPVGQDAVQLILVHHDGRKWSSHQIGNRQSSFRLAGLGTRPLPISRPLVLLDTRTALPRILVVYRDAERQNRITLASCADLGIGKWSFADLTNDSYSAWEPTCDLALWSRDHLLHLFVQKTTQLEGDATPDGPRIPPAQVSILEVTP